MQDFQVGLQLYAGAQELRSFSKVQIESRIRRAREIAGIDSLMIWTDHDLRLYEELVGVCRACGIAPYLWFPVLADVQGTLIAENDLILNYDGSRGYGKTGAWKSLGSGAESFLFYCPNREEPSTRYTGRTPSCWTASISPACCSIESVTPRR